MIQHRGDMTLKPRNMYGKPPDMLNANTLMGSWVPPNYALDQHTQATDGPASRNHVLCMVPEGAT